MSQKIYTINIEEETLKNNNYRKVLYTSNHQQLVVMSINPGEDIPKETHHDHDQFIRVESGKGELISNDSKTTLDDGDIVIIPAGTSHYVKNISANEILKLYTIYSPPEHPKNRLDNRQPKNKLDKIQHENKLDKIQSNIESFKEKYLSYKKKYIELKSNKN